MNNISVKFISTSQLLFDFITLSPVHFTFLAHYYGVSSLPVLLQLNSNTPLSETLLVPGVIMWLFLSAACCLPGDVVCDA